MKDEMDSVDLEKLCVRGAHNRIDMSYGRTQAMIAFGKAGSPVSSQPSAYLMINRTDVPEFLGVLRSLLNAPPSDDPRQHWLHTMMETSGLEVAVGRDYCQGHWSINCRVAGAAQYHALLMCTDAEIREMLSTENVCAPEVQ